MLKNMVTSLIAMRIEDIETHILEPSEKSRALLDRHCDIQQRLQEQLPPDTADELINALEEVTGASECYLEDAMYCHGMRDGFSLAEFLWRYNQERPPRCH